MTTTDDPTQRFTIRAENYARYRPGYPPAVLDCLRDECGLTPETVVVDIGSGTGILTALLLTNGNQVYAVEPNKAMRQEAEQALAGNPKFLSINGRAEATTLPDHSIDLIVVGQAFHWFDAHASRVEFKRILRPGSYVSVIWNARDFSNDPLMAAYEGVLADFGMGHKVINHRVHASDLETLFPDGRRTRTFNHLRPMDFDTLWGGFLSASYAPTPDDPRYEPMRAALQAVFDTHQRDGRVTFVYQTAVNFGRL